MNILDEIKNLSEDILINGDILIKYSSDIIPQKWAANPEH